MKRHHAHQHEFGGGTTTAFRLLTETTTDGDRLTRERAQRALDQAAAAQAQPDLFRPHENKDPLQPARG